MIKSTLTPPTIDQATIDHYVAKGQRERSRAFINFFRSLFAATQKTSVKTVKTAPKAATA